MTSLLIDFETRSNIPIDHGIPNYLNGAWADILMMGYQYNDKEPQLWTPPDQFPISDLSGITVFAHNMQFDFAVWNKFKEKYNMPELDINQCVDTMALCNRYTFPGKLSEVSTVLTLSEKKDTKGKNLIKKITIPPFQYTTEDWTKFKEYCVQDVRTLSSLVDALPFHYLSPYENAIWKLTVKINQVGIPIDIDNLKIIRRTIKEYVRFRQTLLPKLTNNAVHAVSEVKRITDWVHTQGVRIPDLTADTVKETLKRTDLTSEVRDVLTMRKEMGRTSTAKYDKVYKMIHKGRIHNNLVYHKASTGRFAGTGFQAHNLPRSTVDNVEDTIESFQYPEHIMTQSDTVTLAKSLIRSMIKAPKDKTFGIIDYSGIEYRILCWICDEQRAILALHEQRDAYKDMASYMYHINYDDVTPKQRFLGKTLILGCGYNLGSRGFIKYAESYGLDIKPSEAEYGVKAYRNKYKNVVHSWYKWKDLCINAIEHPEYDFVYNKCTFRTDFDNTNTKWLTIKLPSGRKLYYNEPRIKDDMYGKIPVHMGINGYSHKWEQLKLIPGRIAENIVQATARDILCEHKLILDKEGYKIILSVHDEVIIELDENTADHNMSDIVGIMRAAPHWAMDLPLDVEFAINRRYCKI